MRGGNPGDERGDDSSVRVEVGLRPRTHGNVFLRFCIVSSNELVVLDSLENSKQYKNAGKRFRVYGALINSSHFLA